MQLALLHYHLNPGGVTQVIRNHLRALDAAGGGPNVTVLHGGEHSGWPESLEQELAQLKVRRLAVPELGYRSQQSHGPSLAKTLSAALDRAGLSADDTLLHIHNHSLGKHVGMPDSLHQLAEQGYRLLLQVHDFAEDFRPSNYQVLAGEGGELGSAYPQAAHIHYAVLNGRDRNVLLTAGVAASHLHQLPNPIADFPPLPEPDAARQRMVACGVPREHRLLLYPVRGIRRKNVGEALLWSALAEETTVAITLAPRNPAEAASYQHWQRVCERLKLPFVFGIGEPGGPSFLENVAGADALLTTSVAEGFGMVFLESWLAGKPLVGRDLPEISGDFVDAGLQFSGLRSELLIPSDWVGWEHWIERLSQRYNRVARQFGRSPLSVDRIADAFERTPASRERIDFGHLDGELQQQVIEQVAGSAAQRRELLRVNPTIGALLESPWDGWQTRLAEGAAVVRSTYSLERIGQQLLALYQQLARSPLGPVVPLSGAGRILDEFLEPTRFHPVRVE